MSPVHDHLTVRQAVKLFRAEIGVGIIWYWVWPIFMGIIIWISLHSRADKGSRIYALTLLALVEMYATFVVCVHGVPLVARICSAWSHYAKYDLLPSQWSVRLPRNWNTIRCPDYCQTNSGNICNLCEHVVRSSSLLSGSWRLLVHSEEKHCHRTLTSLKNSAIRCSLCSLLRRAVAATASEPRNAGSRLTLTIAETRSLSHGAELKIWLGDQNTVVSEPLVVSHTRFDHSCDASQSTDSRLAAGMIRQWIDACESSHTICNQSPIQKGIFRPRRLIAVGSGNGPTVELVETSDLPDGPVQYIALTHCWGIEEMPVVLKDRTYGAMKLSVSINSLSNTFKDAIQITRNIEVPYIWIDSLCIIQDSPGSEDWKAESQTMGLIYAHATCVVSATASPGSKHGCFRAKRKTEQPSVAILRQGGTNTGICQAVSLANSHANDTLDILFDGFVENAPVSARGWIFQERVLSKRIVHFCDGLILFECNTFRASEHHVQGVIYPQHGDLRRDGTIRSSHEMRNLMTPDKVLIVGYRTQLSGPVSKGERRIYGRLTRQVQAMVPNPNYKSLDEKRIEFLRTAALRGMRGDFQMMLHAKLETMQEKVQFHRVWYEMVKSYSARLLTKNGDRLMGITGIANMIRKSTGREFIHGLWRETVIMDLLWTVVTEPPDQNPEVPTWSWISVTASSGTSIQSLLDPRLTARLNLGISELAKVSVASGFSEMLSLSVKRTIRFSINSKNLDRDLGASKIDMVYLPLIRLGDRNIYGLILKSRDSKKSPIADNGDGNIYTRLGCFRGVQLDDGNEESTILITPRNIVLV